MSQIPGILKGLKVTFRTMIKTLFPGGIRIQCQGLAKVHLRFNIHMKRRLRPQELGALSPSMKGTVPLACFAQESALIGVYILKVIKSWRHHVELVDNQEKSML